MSSLKDRLYNIEQVPPQKVWDKIAAALDESHIDDKFPSRLYEAEAPPPPATWDRIAASMDEVSDAKIIRKKFPLFRYAAAAIITGIIIFGALKWVKNNNETGTSHDVAVVTKPATASKEDNAAKTEPSPANVATQKEEDMVSREENKPVDKAPHVRKALVKKIVKTPGNDFDTEPVFAYNEPAAADLANRYVMLMTPNGIVRMSKKLGGLVCCVSGQEQDEDCKDQLKKWQEKIACAPVAPSPGNFMDILTLVSSLNNKEL